MSKLSRYALYVGNVSGNTPTGDIKYEFEAAGRVRDVARDYGARCALVEFDKAADAKYAWNRMDGFKLDGRRWKVDWASYEDFKFMGWRWFEGPPPSPKRHRSRSRSRTPPVTPHDGADRKRGERSDSLSPAKHDSAERSRSRSRSPASDMA